MQVCKTYYLPLPNAMFEEMYQLLAIAVPMWVPCIRAMIMSLALFLFVIDQLWTSILPKKRYEWSFGANYEFLIAVCVVCNGKLMSVIV